MANRNATANVAPDASSQAAKAGNTLTVAYLSTHDPRDKSSSRGIPYYLTRGLEKAGAMVERFEPLQNEYHRFTKWKRRFYKYVRGQRYTWYHEPKVLKSFAHQIEARLESSQADVILTPEPQVVACREWKRPIAIYTDCFLDNMIDYYPGATNLCHESLRNGDHIERNALQKAALVIGTSDWAAGTAVDAYAVPPSKVHVVPRGATIECDRTEEDIAKLVEARARDVCQLLFVGIDWQRKGGELAIEVARQLNAGGLRTELTVVGCQPDMGESLPDFVNVLGFLDKTMPKERQRFEDAFKTAHFFILASEAEAFGIVFCEASSFGVPSLAPKTGGVASAVREGRNGRIFNYDAAAMADYVQGLFEDYDAYRGLALSSFGEYRTRLNWQVAGRSIKQLLQKVA